MELYGIKPERRVLLSFLLVILTGSVLLMLPISSVNGVRYVDALFTSTSAVCVTGLTVVDIGAVYTLFGQIVILILIQIGGLGVMTLATALVVRFTPYLSFMSRLTIAQTIGSGERLSTRFILKAVLITTAIIEGIGALALFLVFIREFPWHKALYLGIFHAISAFCNAGFSPFGQSLEGYADSLPIIFIFSLLIITGGLGFVVVGDLWRKITHKNHRLSLHSKLCLVATTALLVAGTLGIWAAEGSTLLPKFGFINGIANCFFQSVTARTAGFNTIPQASLTDAAILLTMILMFIGVCPGSTGGGVKATTISIVMLLAISRLRGRATIAAFKRSISEDSILRALTVIMAALMAITLLFLVFQYAQPRPESMTHEHGWFVESNFELMSAFGTVGLSLGITPHLQDSGKIIIMILMFFGRIGLLTLVISLARPSQKGELVYTEEQVMVG